MTTLERGRGATVPTPATPETGARWAAATVALAPAWLLAALLYHPFIADLSDKRAVAAAAAADPARWGLSHLAVGVGSALLLLAFLAVRSRLRQAGEERWSVLAIPFLVVGSTLFAFLPAMEIAMLGVLAAGGDVRAVLVAMDPWFVPILLAGSATYAAGVIALGIAVVRARVLGPWPARLVAGFLVLSAVGRFVPATPALYVGAAATVAALWPLARRIGRPG